MFNNIKELARAPFKKLVLLNIKPAHFNCDRTKTHFLSSKSVKLLTPKHQRIKCFTHQQYHLKSIDNFSLFDIGLQSNLKLNTRSTYWTDRRLYSTHVHASRSSVTNSDLKEESSTTKTKLLFTNVKNVLHNYYDVLSHELKEKDLKLNPTYKKVKNNKKTSLWMCSYNLKWPEVKKFSGVASTKQEASTNAAADALKWLLENKKITKYGQPIIYGKKDIETLKKQNYLPLEIDEFTCNLMDKVLSDDRLNAVFVKEKKEEIGLGVESVKEEWPSPVANQVCYDTDFYLCKEQKPLPISDYKDTFIKMLENNNVVIIKGEPGCGKSTRVPQYVMEAWAKKMQTEGVIKPCRIIVTEPRRIAAISLAERVANEREEYVGPTIGYQVRLKSNFNRKTGRILYCTTGILLRHIQSSVNLNDVTHVVVDEAHERDVNIDLLLNLLRHALKLNTNLKVIIMSATIDAKEFQKYFDGAPILNIPGFAYPVKEYYSSDRDYPKTHEMCKTQYANVVHEDVANCVNYIHKNKPEGAILCFLPGWDDIIKVKDLIPSRNDLSVLCLHSGVDITDQQKIFCKPPPGVRKIILSTNIAETSVTIDDVVYVIDTGIHKEQKLNVENGMMCIDNYWISEASATQRKGRAGRCQPGECFRLYPKSKYDEFIDYSIPEILRTRLTKIVLDSKVYSNNMNASEFLQQLICPPNEAAIKHAVEELMELEMLDKNENLTSLGRIVSDFQLPPKLSKAMVNSLIFKCVTPVVDIVTLYSIDSSLYSKSIEDKSVIRCNMENFSKTSDHLGLAELFEKWLHHIENKEFTAAQVLCNKFGIMQYKLKTVQKLRNIHLGYLYEGLYDVLPISDDFSDNYELVMGVLLSGVGNVLQKRTWDIVKGRFKNSNVLVTRHNRKATITSESVNSRKGQDLPQLLVYINETISNLRHTTLVRETSFISPLSLLLFTNSKLVVESIEEEDITHISDEVLVKLEGTDVGFRCSERQATCIQQFKGVLEKFEKYYIHQLTEGNIYDSAINACWQSVLQNLNEILNRAKVS